MLEQQRGKTDGIAQHDEEDTGYLRVERTRTTHLTPEHLSHPCRNFVAGGTSRFLSKTMIPGRFHRWTGPDIGGLVDRTLPPRAARYAFSAASVPSSDPSPVTTGSMPPARIARWVISPMAIT